MKRRRGRVQKEREEGGEEEKGERRGREKKGRGLVGHPFAFSSFRPFPSFNGHVWKGCKSE